MQPASFVQDLLPRCTAHGKMLQEVVEHAQVRVAVHIKVL